MRRLSLFEVSGGRELVICKGLAQPQLVQFASGGVGEFVDKFDAVGYGHLVSLIAQKLQHFFTAEALSFL